MERRAISGLRFTLPVALVLAGRKIRGTGSSRNAIVLQYQQPATFSRRWTQQLAGSACPWAWELELELDRDPTGSQMLVLRCCSRRSFIIVPPFPVLTQDSHCKCSTGADRVQQPSPSTTHAHSVPPQPKPPSAPPKRPFIRPPRQTPR